MINFSMDPLNEEIVADIQPLLDENHAVSGQFETLDIYWDLYLAMAAQIIVFRMKEEELTVGVLIFFVGTYPHNKNETYAEQLTFYVQPEYRKDSLKLLNLSEKILPAHGCDFVVQSARVDTPFCKTLERSGYEPLDMKYAKRL